MLLDEQIISGSELGPEVISYINAFIESNVFPLEILTFLLTFENMTGLDMSGEYIDEDDDDSPELQETDMEMKTRLFFETIVYMFSRVLNSRKFRDRPLPDIITELSAIPQVRVYFYKMLINKGKSKTVEV